MFKSNIIIPINEEDDFFCRICLEQDIKKNLISPCRCSGTLKHVHPYCINTWRKTTGNIVAKTQCLQCLTPYAVLSIGKLPHSILFSKLSPCMFIIFLQYTLFYMMSIVYKILFKNSFVYNFYYGSCTIYMFEFLYCLYIWCFYVKQKTIAVLRLLSIFVFASPILYLGFETLGQKSQHPIERETNIVIFIIIQIINISINNSIYFSLLTISKYPPNYLSPCTNLIENTT